MTRQYYLPSEELLQDSDLQEFFRGIASLSSAEDIGNILSDALAPKELETLKNRWRCVKMLSRGIPYRAIAKKLNLSTTTVTRAALSLKRERGGWSALLKLLSYSIKKNGME